MAQRQAGTSGPNHRCPIRSDALGPAAMRGFSFALLYVSPMVDAGITILHPTLPAIHAETCEFRVGILIAGQFVGVYALQDFTRMLEEQIPRLRRYAHALCRDR